MGNSNPRECLRQNKTYFDFFCSDIFSTLYFFLIGLNMVSPKHKLTVFDYNFTLNTIFLICYRPLHSWPQQEQRPEKRWRWADFRNSRAAEQRTRTKRTTYSPKDQQRYRYVTSFYHELVKSFRRTRDTSGVIIMWVNISSAWQSVQTGACVGPELCQLVCKQKGKIKGQNT